MIQRFLNGNSSKRSLVLSAIGGITLLLLALTVFAVASQARSLSSQAEEAVQAVENLRGVSNARAELSIASRIAQSAPGQRLVVSGALENAESALDSVEQNFNDDTPSEILTAFADFREAAVAQGADLQDGDQTPETLRSAEIATGEAFTTLAEAMRAQQVGAIEGLQEDNDLMNLIATISTFIVAFVVPSAGLFIFQALRRTPREMRELRLEHDQLLNRTKTMAATIATETSELRSDMRTDQSPQMNERIARSLLRIEHVAAFNGAPTSLRNSHLDVNEIVELAIEQSDDDGFVEFISDQPRFAIADSEQLQLVVSELLTNALTHGAAPVRILTDTQEDSIEIRVIDGGHGLPTPIPEAILDEREYELRSNMDHGDYGFGLLAARRAVESMGGQLRYERVGSETHLIASLPISQSKLNTGAQRRPMAA